MDVEQRGDLVQRVGRELVVVIQQCGELAGDETEGRVGSVGDVAVPLAEHGLDPRVLAHELLEQGTNVGGRRGVVGEAEFPVRVDLPAYAVDGAAEPDFIVGRPVIHRHHDGD